MPFLKHKTIVILLLVASAVSLYSQEMTLQEVIDSARTRSVSAVAAKSNFVPKQKKPILAIRLLLNLLI